MSEVMLEQSKKVKGLSATSLKFIAIAAMLIDHIAWQWVPKMSVLGQGMHIIGRITVCIMCFFIVEGYYHTRNIESYILRLSIFAIISHVPYTFYETGQLRFFPNTSVIYTLLLSLLALIAYKNINNKVLRLLAIVALSFLCMIGDWMCITILMTLNFAKFRGNFKKIAIGHILITTLTVLGMTFISSKTDNIGEQLFQFGMILALPIIYFYNGQKGEFANKHKQLSRWVFYVFYPAHLIILGIIKFVL